MTRSAAVVFCLALAACDRRDAMPRVDAIANAAPSSPVAVSSSTTASATPREVVYVPQVAIAGRGPTTVHVAWRLPAGTGVNADAPFHVRWKMSEGLERAPDEMHAKGADVSRGFDVVVTPTAGSPSATLTGDVNVVVCDVVTHRVCVPVERRIEMEFLVVGKMPSATVDVPLPAAKPQGS
jgi:hypothetical protein